MTRKMIYADSHDVPEDFECYLDECRSEGKRQWCYAEFVDDHLERAEQAYNLGETAAEFIKWLGEKYDLTTYDEGF